MSSSQPLEPALVEMAQRWKASGIPTDLYVGDGPAMRDRGVQVRNLFYPKPVLVSGPIEALTLPGPNGDIPARIVWPASGKPDATLVYFHGGGWILGDLDSHEAHAIRLANEANVVVLNVGYRLAPEDPFPAGIDDAIAATEWAHAHLSRLGGNPGKLAVGGDSAGGNLAAVVALHCRDAGIVLAAQLLIYPATDLTGAGHGMVREHYLGADAAAKAANPRVSPRHAASLAGIAPVILGVGAHDFLYQDNMAYVAALRAANVPLLLREYPTLNHGFFSFTAVSPASLGAVQQLCADLGKLLHG